jgi:predicted ATPase
VDNFRGFTDALFPIAPVSFLVGENSTGKSSILSLIQLLGSFRFWTRLSFRTEETTLGGFSDIVSANAKNRDYFRIGVITAAGQMKARTRVSRPEREDLFTTTFLMTFVSNKGVPELRYYSVCNQGRIIHFHFLDEKVRYRIDPKTYPEPATLEVARKVADGMLSVHRSGQRVPFKVLDTKHVNRTTDLVFNAYIFVQALSKQEKLPDDFDIQPFPRGAGTYFLAPIRSRAKRTYDEPTKDYSSEGDHVPYLIQELLEHKKKRDRFSRLLETAGRDTGLFRSIEPRSYGRGANAPFELDVVLENKPINILNVGYGVSQSMPIIVESINQRQGSWFVIQQPEVHLHPKAQAGIGGLLFALASTEHKKFLVETHSDYLIDRFRLMYRDAKHTPSSQILFFERKEGFNTATSIPIGSDGSLPDAQPDGYRGFFVKEQLALLGLE